MLSQLVPCPNFYDLSRNEESLGPAPKVRSQLKNSIPNLQHYADPDCLDLRTVIAKWQNLNPQQILCGNGSEEIIYILAQAILSPGDHVLTNAHAFSAYSKAAQNANAKVIKAPMNRLHTDSGHILESVTPQTKILFLDNPGNPTSTYVERQAFQTLLTNLPQHILLVLDEAYYEYVDIEKRFTGLDYVKPDSNLVVLRTFSKFYGLAGLRCGWAYGNEELIKRVAAFKPPLSMNRLAQELTPVAMANHPHYEKVYERNTHFRNQLMEHFENLGFSSPHSQTNFVSPDFKTPDICKAYQMAYQNQGILTHSCSGQGLDSHLRIAIGDDDAMDKVMKIIL